jgi:hypothetical protein
MHPKYEWVQELHERTRVLFDRCGHEIERAKRAKMVSERLARALSTNNPAAREQPGRKQQ